MKLEFAYQQALDYLYSYIDFSLVKSDRYSPERFHLGRMEDLLRTIGDPHLEYPIIHIAGTKGKGSVAALCASALEAAGYQVGLYTSPHLVDFTERIQINKHPIDHKNFIEHVDWIKPFVESIPELTTFEITTAMAFDHFAKEGVTAAVIEVGLGGRLDATNVVTPVTSVITSISFDHTQFLGESLVKIATEKGGIIKPGIPVVSAPQKDVVISTITRIAQEKVAPLTLVGRDTLFAPFSRSLTGQSMLVWSAAEQPLVDAYIESGGHQEWEPVRIYLPLLGAHQVENAATAYTALQVANSQGLSISEKAIREGFAQVKWPGRFEVIHHEPIVVIDSAHNRFSALKLRLALDDYFPGRPVILVFGASEDKDIQGMFTELLPRVRKVVATQSIHPRAMDPEEIVNVAHRFGCPAQSFPTIEAALEAALRRAGMDTVILVAGSIFIAAGAREVWNQVIQKEHVP